MHGCICFRTTADANYSRHYSLVWPYKGSFKWELVVTLKPEVDCWSHFCFNCNLFKRPNVLISSVFTTLRNERQENKDTNLVFDLLFAFLFINGLLVELMYLRYDVRFIIQTHAKSKQSISLEVPINILCIVHGVLGSLYTTPILPVNDIRIVIWREHVNQL